MAIKNEYILVTKAEGAKKTKKQLDKVTGSVGGLALKVIGLAGAFYAGKGLLNAFGGAVSVAGDFGKGLKEIQTLTGGSTEEFAKMSKSLLSLSVRGAQSLGDLTKAQYDVVSAGFSMSKVIDGVSDATRVLDQSMTLAVGGVTDVSTGADLLTSALNAYKLEATDVEAISDTFFTTVKLGKTTIDELASSMGQVMPIASVAGISLDTLGASMATLTASGVSTAEASTQLKNVFLSLSAPTDTAKKAMKEAGIEVKRFDDGTMDLSKTLAQFSGKSLEELKKFIPNITAISAVASLSDNIASLEDNIDSMAKKAGASKDAMATMTDSWNFQVDKLKANFNTIRIVFGQAVIEKLKPQIKEANKVLAELGDIGWDKIAKAIGKNTSLVFAPIGKIVKILLKPIPALVGKVFLLAGKGAVKAFKIGLEGFQGIDWGDIIFGNEKLQNVVAFAGIVGRDSAIAFIDSMGEEVEGINDILTDMWASGMSEADILKVFMDAGISASLAQQLIDGAETGTKVAHRTIKNAFGDVKLTEGMEYEKEFGAIADSFVGQMEDAYKEVKGIIAKGVDAVKGAVKEDVEGNEKGNQDKTKSNDIYHRGLMGAIYVFGINKKKQREDEANAIQDHHTGLFSQLKLMTWEFAAIWKGDATEKTNAIVDMIKGGVELAQEMTGAIGSAMIDQNNAELSIVDKTLKTKKDLLAEAFKKDKAEAGLIKNKIKRETKLAELELAYLDAVETAETEAGAKRKEIEKETARIQILMAVINTAQAILKTMTDVAYPANIPLAIAQGIAGAIQVNAIKTATSGMAEGGDFITDGATNLTVGEAGRERVTVTPLERRGLDFAGGSGGDTFINVSFEGNVLTQDFVENEVIDAINTAVERGHTLRLEN